MSKLYLVDVGFSDPTIIYELVPKEIARLHRSTLAETEAFMRSRSIKNVVVDSGHPEVIDDFLMQGFNILKGRVPDVKE